MRRLLGLLAVVAAVGSTLPAGAGPARAAAAPFDVGSPERVAMNARLAGPTVMQSFGQDPVRRQLFFSQLRRRSTGDVTLTRLRRSGAVAGVMVLRGAGHGVGLGVEHVAGATYVWTGARARRRADGLMSSTAVARFRWRDGQTVDLRAVARRRRGVQVVALRRCAFALPVLDAAHHRLAVRCSSPSGALRDLVFARYRFLHGDRTVIASVAEPPMLASFQGLALHGGWFYRIEGDAYSPTNVSPGNITLTSYDFSGRTGGQAPQTAATDLEHREPEGVAVVVLRGVPHLAYGIASGPLGRRVASVVVKN